jgi:predicted RNA-binding protein with PUA-like domain
MANDARRVRRGAAKRGEGLTMQYWLFKSEPDAYGIDRLEREGRTEWSGVRNFQARNNMVAMGLGDLGFFYHSSIKVPGIVGICKVIKEAYPDFTQFDPKSDYYDPASKPDAPKWMMVDVGFVEKFPAIISLEELRLRADLDLRGMPLLRRGQRLSVQPVEARYWDAILQLQTAR